MCVRNEEGGMRLGESDSKSLVICPGTDVVQARVKCFNQWGIMGSKCYNRKIGCI